MMVLVLDSENYMKHSHIAFGHMNGIGHENKVISEWYMLIRDLNDSKVYVVVEVIDLMSDEKSRTHSSVKSVFDLSEVESKFVHIVNPSITKTKYVLVNSFKISDLQKEFDKLHKLNLAHDSPRNTIMSRYYPIKSLEHPPFVQHKLVPTKASFIKKIV